MTKHDDELKKTEELLKSQKIRKVPQETLANFSGDVMKRIETETSGTPGWKVVLGLALMGILTAGLTLLVVQHKPLPERVPEPVPVTTEVAPTPQVVPVIPEVEGKELTLEEELLLLEEFADEGLLAAQLESLLGEKEYLAEEMELFQTLGFGVRS